MGSWSVAVVLNFDLAFDVHSWSFCDMFFVVMWVSMSRKKPYMHTHSNTFIVDRYLWSFSLCQFSYTIVYINGARYSFLQLIQISYYMILRLYLKYTYIISLPSSLIILLWRELNDTTWDSVWVFCVYSTESHCYWCFDNIPDWLCIHCWILNSMSMIVS